MVCGEPELGPETGPVAKGDEDDETHAEEEESPVGGFWRRKRKGEEGEDDGVGEREEEGENLTWVSGNVRVSGDGEIMDVLLQKRDDDGENTGEFETATEHDIVAISPLQLQLSFSGCEEKKKNNAMQRSNSLCDLAVLGCRLPVYVQWAV